MNKTSAKPLAKPANSLRAGAPRTLAVDIGGTGIKALTLDAAGKPLNERTRIATPKRATPKAVIEIIRKLAKAQAGFERVSVGFPGVVKDGVIYTAANLGKGWAGFDLRQALERRLKKPVRVANDADIQGLGCVTGNGLELVITLGTGFGSVLFADGRRIHLELGHHPFHKGKTYEDELGERALKKKGRKKWNKLLREAIDDLQRTFNFDALYIGGGNSRLVTFKLPPGVKTISNEDGLLGGIALWRDAQPEIAKRREPKPKAKAAPAKSPSVAIRKPPMKAVRKTAASVVAVTAPDSGESAASEAAEAPPSNGSARASGVSMKKSAVVPSPAS